MIGICKSDIHRNIKNALSITQVHPLGIKRNYNFFAIDEHVGIYKLYNNMFCMASDSSKKRKNPKSLSQIYDESVEYYKDNVQRFIDLIKNNSRIKLSKLVYFPLHRHYPLPSIKTADEFLKRFDEVFDKKLIGIICSSDTNKDWEGMGWRGVMLNSGILWLEYNGKLRSVNYESEIEKRKRLELIEADRKTLHSSLKVFIEPVLEWKTKKYQIRIDRLSEYKMGEHRNIYGDKYRYAAWSVNKLPGDEPDLIIYDGECIPDGNGGNHHYDFKKDVYLYRCYVGVLRSLHDPPGWLEVYKTEKCILKEPVITSSESD
jgi:hypothetical protein